MEEGDAVKTGLNAAGEIAYSQIQYVEIKRDTLKDPRPRINGKIIY